LNLTLLSKKERVIILFEVKLQDFLIMEILCWLIIMF